MKARRIIALVLSALMLIGVFQISASAAGKTEFGMIDQYCSDSFKISEHENVLEALYQGCMAHQNEINIQQYNIPKSDVSALFSALVGVYPELFFVGNAYSYSSSGTKLITLNVQYIATKEQADAMLVEFYDKADEYLELVDDDMDDFTKALVLHDALVLNNEYDIDRYVNNVYVYSSNYTFMVDGWGRCENYAECYAYLLSKVGIKSEIINSEDMVHEWMKIQLGSENYYYNVDVTWDDPVYTGIGDMPDKVSHNYFLLSDEAVDFGDHYDYEYINESDDAYDDHATLHSLDNPMFYIGGKIYTLYTKSGRGYIAAYRHADDLLEDVLEIDDTWSAGGYYTWSGNFSGLGMDKGVLYYNGENCVYCYDPTTGVSVCWLEDIFSNGSQIYGLYVKDGEIWGGIATSPNETAEFQYLDDCIPFYQVTVDDSIENGAVTVSKDATFAGNTVTLTVTPDEGYELEGVSVNGEALEPVGGLYSFEMPAENAVVSAVFQKESIIAGHSISLYGDIGVNFYYLLSDAEAEGKTVSFTWTVNDQENHASDVLEKDDDTGYYKATCPIAVAEMTYDVTATVTIGEETVSDSYSAVKYAKNILSEDYRTRYLTDHTNEQYGKLAELVKTMLYYGARAQVKFDRDKENLADSGIGYNPAQVTAETIGDTDADEMGENLQEYGLEYTGSTVVYLSETTLRHYYKIVNQAKFDQVKDNITFGGDEPIGYTKKNGQIFFEKKNIAAADLDTMYTITIGNSAYQFSVLDYVKACLDEASTVSEEMKTLAAATYLYNQAANAYFNQ